MDARQTFVTFVARVLTPDQAKHFATLAESEPGQKAILAALGHEFWPAISPDTHQTTDYKPLWETPCLAYFAPMGFGMAFETLRDAYEQLAIEDGWLVILQGATIGIHRPEGRWDLEKILAPPTKSPASNPFG